LLEAEIYKILLPTN